MSGSTGALNTPHSDHDPVLDTDVRDILGVKVRAISREKALEEINQLVRTKRHQKYAFLNAHGANIAYADVSYRTLLNDFRVLSDGVGVDLGSKILYGEKFPANLNGTDFIPRLFNFLKQPAHIALLGAKTRRCR